MVGNVWQCTRDVIKIKDDSTAHLVFGASQTARNETSLINSLCRPIYYDDNKGKGIGLRLVRYKRQKELCTRKVYQPCHINWNQDSVDQDSDWWWDKTFSCIILKDDAKSEKINKELGSILKYLLTENVHFSFIDELNLNNTQINQLIFMCLYVKDERISIILDALISKCSYIEMFMIIRLDDSNFTDPEIIEKLFFLSRSIEYIENFFCSKINQT